MGRTLSYDFTKADGSNFTKNELQKIWEIDDKYASEPFSELWSCEWLDLDPTNFYPNWDKIPTREAFDKLYKFEHEKKKQEGLSDFEIFDFMVKQKIVIPTNDKKQIGGFTKTQGNELNSLMVLQALVEVSKAVPKGEVSIRDEGEFLMCPLKIRNGKAIPILTRLVDDIQSFSHLMMFSEGFNGNVLKDLNFKEKDFTYEFRMGVSINNSYGNMVQYINEKLRNIKDVETVLIKARIKGSDLYFQNIESRKPSNWFDPFSFTRKVDIEKFINYKMSPATLMDGFSGEGFGLSDGDSEYDSYKAIADMQKVVTKLGLDKENLKVLGEK